MQGRPTLFEQRRCSDGAHDRGRRSGTFLSMKKSTARTSTTAVLLAADGDTYEALQ
jgi:hypothetical protein